MRSPFPMLWTLALLVTGWVVARPATSQVPVPSAACENTCDADVIGPRQGRHTALDSSADSVLWPPNHKLRAVSIAASNNDGDECNVTIIDVTQDEAVDEPGSGNTSPDATGCDNSGNTSTISLRGERSGMGTGRYYHVSFTMEDPDCPGQAATDDARVLVPHDQGVSSVSVDEGPLSPSCSGACCP